MHSWIVIFVRVTREAGNVLVVVAPPGATFLPNPRSAGRIPQAVTDSVRFAESLEVAFVLEAIATNGGNRFLTLPQCQ